MNAVQRVGLLVALGAVAAVGAVVLSRTMGGEWPILPLAVWGIVFITIRAPASVDRTEMGRNKRGESRRDRQVTRSTEMMHAEIGAQIRAGHEVRERLGTEGYELLLEAQGSVNRILSTEAARQGWLGAAEGLRFDVELESITATLDRAADMRSAIAESVAVLDSSSEDAGLVEDARTAVDSLEESVRSRVMLLQRAAAEAIKVDRVLARERAEARLVERRDLARSRLTGLLHGERIRPTESTSNPTDAITALAAAFLELKGVIDRQPAIAEITRAASSDRSATDPATREPARRSRIARFRRRRG